MRNSPIHVERPYGATHTAFARMGGKFGGRPQGRLINTLVAQNGNEMARPALQGLAALYGVPFVPTVKGASGLRFKLQAGTLDTAAVRLLVDHDDQNLHGSTDSGLVLASSSYGVAFRFPLTPDNGLVLSALVASGGRDAVSVGLDDIYGFTEQDEDGDIFVITKAKLTEISLVISGACTAAFASVVDLDTLADSFWYCTSNAGGTLGSTGIVFAQLSLTPADGSITYSKMAAGVIRERLTTNRTYYVRTDGSDSNAGLVNTSGGAFLTVQKALDVASALDFGTFDVTVQIADGTYAPGSGTPVADVRPWAGSGSLIIQGNTTTPANVVLSATAANVIDVSRGAIPGKLQIKGLKLQTTTSGTCLALSQACRVEPSNLDFGFCATVHMSAAFAAFIAFQTNYTVSGGAIRHWSASTFGRIDAANRTVTITGTPAFSAFAFASMGYLAVSGMTFSGSATGARYDANLNGIVYTGGAGATYLPGNAAGAAATGGQYV